jgi:deoxyribodipyrimidine photo-lyase
VARFAPPDWHSPGSVIDTGYEALDALARSPHATPVTPVPGGMAEPPLLATPPVPPAHTPPPLAGRHVLLQHPWALGAIPAEVPADAVVLGLVLRDAHRRPPWSERRWRFVLDGWQHSGVPCWCVDADGLGRGLADAAVVWLHDDPHLRPWRQALPPQTRWLQAPPLFAEVDGHCASFSRWWQRTRLIA